MRTTFWWKIFAKVFLALSHTCFNPLFIIFTNNTLCCTMSLCHDDKDNDVDADGDVDVDVVVDFVFDVDVDVHADHCHYRIHGGLVCQCRAFLHTMIAIKRFTLPASNKRWKYPDHNPHHHHHHYHILHCLWLSLCLCVRISIFMTSPIVISYQEKAMSLQLAI